VGVVVVGVGDIGYPQPLWLLPAGAQGARPLSPNGIPAVQLYTVRPCRATRHANANSRRSSIYRPRPKQPWHSVIC